jgi:hypothetical protein
MVALRFVLALDAPPGARHGGSTFWRDLDAAADAGASKIRISHAVLAGLLVRERLASVLLRQLLRSVHVIGHVRAPP